MYILAFASLTSQQRNIVQFQIYIKRNIILLQQIDRYASIPTVNVLLNWLLYESNLQG